MTKGLCKICGKEKTLVYYGLCDSCYRKEIMSVYKYYRLKKEYKSIDNIKSEKHRRVLRLAIWYDKPFVEIGKILELKPRLVSWIVNKYCYRCDIEGNPRPEEYCQQKNKKIL